MPLGFILLAFVRSYASKITFCAVFMFLFTVGKNFVKGLWLYCEDQTTTSSFGQSFLFPWYVCLLCCHLSYFVPFHFIFFLDLTLWLSCPPFPSADTRLNELRDAQCVVSHDGGVVWIPQAIFKSSCSIDITHFPFDVQTCHLKFGSWTYDGSKLDLQFLYGPYFELNDYIRSNEWDIVDSSAKRNVKYYPCCPEPYVDLVFNLKMRRKVAFYNYILILPCVLLSSLTLVLFWLPPESPAKMQLGNFIFPLNEPGFLPLSLNLSPLIMSSF